MYVCIYVFACVFCLFGAGSVTLGPSSSDSEFISECRERYIFHASRCKGFPSLSSSSVSEFLIEKKC